MESPSLVDSLSVVSLSEGVSQKKGRLVSTVLVVVVSLFSCPVAPPVLTDSPPTPVVPSVWTESRPTSSPYFFWTDPIGDYSLISN